MGRMRMHVCGRGGRGGMCVCDLGDGCGHVELISPFHRFMAAPPQAMFDPVKACKRTYHSYEDSMIRAAGMHAGRGAEAWDAEEEDRDEFGLGEAVGGPGGRAEDGGAAGAGLGEDELLSEPSNTRARASKGGCSGPRPGRWWV